MKKQLGFAAYDLLMCFVFIAGIAMAWGWVWNVIKLIAMLDGGFTAMFFARIVGVFAAPMGSILGYF